MRHLAHGFLALALSATAPALALGQQEPLAAALAQQVPPAPPSAQGAAPAPAPAPAVAQKAPPARVGRVSFVAGQLGFHTKGETAWSAAAVNFPVATGGSFWTDPKTRAEFRIGAQTIALSNSTAIDIARLDAQVMQIAVPEGRVELRLRQLGERNSVEIDIPRGGVWLLQPGIYDIDAGSPGTPARIMVFEGSARFVGGTLDIAIKAGDAAVISGTDTLTATIEKAAPDAFAQWCRSRDYREQRLAAPYYVSPRMTGYETLDEYGAWRAVPEYGEVWFPRSVPADWVPYRNGYWSWVEPWGWNWIASEPWGFAPYHYGRWASIGNDWGWVPGAFVTDPVYAPALVGFYSDPAAIVAAAVTGALTGWFPLGPGEAYWPSYTSDPSYIRAVNAGIVADPGSLGIAATGDPANATRMFANRGAATVVSQRAFAAGLPLARAALPVSAAAAQQARVTGQAPLRSAAVARGGTAARFSGSGSGTAARAFRGAGGTSANAAAAFAGHGSSAPPGMARMGATHGAASHGGGGAAFRGASAAAFRGGGGSHRGGGGAVAFHGGGAPHVGGGGGGRHGGGGGPPAGGGGGSHAGGPHTGGGRAPHAGGGGGSSHSGGGGGSHAGGGGGGSHANGKGHG